ncbi:AarF/ABC1/UbiB kinase family protein [Candidatus Saccharibacteria bacterium]|nr:AarF/ABC1/UbiB kinase family protein [Candidatus Saccharibacteria bacterium]
MNKNDESRSEMAVKLGLRLLRVHFSRGDQNQVKREIFAGFKEMGGPYVKFLQVLAAQPDFLRGWATPSETQVFEDVALEPIDIIRVLEYLDRNYRAHFAAVDREPMAAGSFGQVYRAQLTNGQVVIIKVLRPSVSRYLKTDMKNLGRMVRLLALVNRGGSVDLREGFSEFKRITELETDYRLELKNALWFAEYFRGHEQIIIPKTYAELSTDRVLVQDFVGGVSLAEAMIAQQNGANIADWVMQATGSDIWAQLQTLGNTLLISSIDGDYIFGDPHPGNIKLLPDNKIGFIDFGIAASAPTSRHAFVDLIREYYNLYMGQFRPAEFMVAALAFFDNILTQAISVATDNLLRKNIFDFIGEAAGRVFETHKHDELTKGYLDNLQMTRLITQVINKGNRFNVKLDMSNLAMLRASQMYMSMVNLIVKRSDLPMSVANQIIRNSFKTMVDYADAGGVAQSSTRAESLSDERALQMFGDWAAGIADRDPQLYRQIREGAVF